MCPDQVVSISISSIIYYLAWWDVSVAVRQTKQLAIAPSTPGIPCKLWTPHVSWSLSFLRRTGCKNNNNRLIDVLSNRFHGLKKRFRTILGSQFLTCKYWYPNVETRPATVPMMTEAYGRMIMFALAPIITPPANVAFWMCTFDYNSRILQFNSRT